MLQSIRDRTHGWIAGSIISLLIFSFALWGIHSYLMGAGNSNIVAKVNGTEVTQNQLNASYERMRQLEHMRSKSGLVESTESNLKQRVLQSLVTTEALKQASLAANYRITNEQINAVLQTIPEFQDNGQFSLTRFQQMLTASMLTPGEFLSSMQTSLLIDQPKLGIIFTSFALPAEVENSIALVGQQRQIQYLVLSQQYFAKQPIPVSDAEIQAYYAQHQEEFKTPEQVSIEYITLSVAAFNNNKLSKDDARQQALDEFSRAKEKLANTTYEHPDSLSTAAQQLSLPIKTTQLFTKEKGAADVTHNAKVRETAFSNDVLTSQNNSDVIEVDPDTVMVLRIKNHVPAAALPIEVVRNQIAEKLKAQKTASKLSQLAAEIQNKLQSGQITEAQVASAYHSVWVNAGWSGRHSAKISQAILDSAFEMPKPQSQIKTTYVVAKMTDGIAMIALTAVKDDSVSNISKEQRQAFADQVQTTLGALEYELYKESLQQSAKVVMEN